MTPLRPAYVSIRQHTSAERRMLGNDSSQTCCGLDRNHNRIGAKLAAVGIYSPVCAPSSALCVNIRTFVLVKQVKQVKLSTDTTHPCTRRQEAWTLRARITTHIIMVSILIYIYTYVYAYINIYIYILIYIYIYINIHIYILIYTS